MSSQTANSRAAQATCPAVDSASGCSTQGSAMIPMQRSRCGPPLADLMQDCTAAESAASGLADSLRLPVAVSISAAHATRPAFAATTLITVPSIVPLGGVRRIDHARAGLLEAVDLRHFLVGQNEIEDREIGGEMLGVGGARNRDDALLHEIAQLDLRRALAVRLADALERLVAGNLAARQRTIGRHRKAMPAAGGQHLALIEKWMDFDLVGHQGFVREPDRIFQQGGGEIRDPDMSRATVALGLTEDAEGLRQRNVRIRPVDEEQIDPGQLELGEAFIERALEIIGRELVVIDLGCDENVLAPEAGVPQTLVQPLPHRSFIVVAFGGVDMTIAQSQGGLDRSDTDRALKRHGAKADGGNPCAVGFDDFHCVLL